MIDLNKSPAYFAILHHDTGSHDEAIKRLAAHYYQRGIDEGHRPDRRGNYTNGCTTIAVDTGGGVGIVLALDNDDPSRLGCHTSWPHQADRAGEPCQNADQNLPACAGCGRMA